MHRSRIARLSVTVAATVAVAFAGFGIGASPPVVGQPAAQVAAAVAEEESRPNRTEEESQGSPVMQRAAVRDTR